MSTTVFSTPYFASWRPERLARGVRQLLATWLLLAAGWCSAWAAELTGLRTERGDEGIYLTATVKFELPPAVEEALLKGVALIFVAEADIYRERWYWTDLRASTAVRSMRLAYQPLTRRWRVSLGGEGGGRVTLAQTYDTLAEAQAAIERISRWKIAELADVEGSGHYLDFRFRLDLSQLPRPFQIGIAGPRDWQISLARSQRLRLERRAADMPAADK